MLAFSLWACSALLLCGAAYGYYNGTFPMRDEWLPGAAAMAWHRPLIVGSLLGNGAVAPGAFWLSWELYVLSGLFGKFASGVRAPNLCVASFILCVGISRIFAAWILFAPTYAPLAAQLGLTAASAILAAWVIRHQRDVIQGFLSDDPADRSLSALRELQQLYRGIMPAEHFTLLQSATRAVERLTGRGEPEPHGPAGQG